MSDNGIKAVQWAPRIAPEKIRRLYESEARGVLEEVLLDDILIGLYLRCHSIMTATEAFYGRVECPCCGAIISHPAQNSDKKYVLQCPTCPWQVTWGEYFHSYQHKQLFWGGAFPAIWEYMDGFFSARTRRDKLLLLDRLIHTFHWEMINFRAATPWPPWSLTELSEWSSRCSKTWPTERRAIRNLPPGERIGRKTSADGFRL